MATKLKPISGSIQPKHGKLYVVVNLYINKKRTPKWVSTECLERNGKRQANLFMNELLQHVNTYKQRPSNALKKQLFTELEAKPNLLEGLNLLIEELERDEEVKAALFSRSPSKRLIADQEMLFIDYLRRWLLTKQTGDEKTDIEDSTYESYEIMINGRISKYFQERYPVTLCELEPEHFEEFYAGIIESGRTSSTALHFHRVMYQALKYAVKKRIIRYNVLDAVDTPAGSNYVADHFTDEEAIEMLSKVKGHKMYIPILLATYYGLRRSEVLGIRWSSIDFKNKTISIQRKIISKKVKGGGKTLKDTNRMKTSRSRRTLPLIPFVAKELEAEYCRQQELKLVFAKSKKFNQSKEGHICIDEFGYVLKPEFITKSFRPLLTKIGFEHTIRFHDLRHTCASLLIQAGVPLIKVAMFLGHSNTVITEKTYVHTNDNMHIETAEVMSAILDRDSEKIVDEIITAINNNNESTIQVLFNKLTRAQQKELVEALGKVA